MRVVSFLLLSVGLMSFGQTPAGLDPKIMIATPPDKIHWLKAPGVEMAVLWGDPEKAIPFGLLVHCFAGSPLTPPHRQPKDRHIVVVGGTYWVATGTKVEPEKMTPFRSYATIDYKHKDGMHYDGAKDEDYWILVTGEGPIIGLPKEKQ